MLHEMLARSVRAAGGGRMRAWRAHAYGPVAELRLDDARVPPLLAPDDVLVRVRAASLNPIDLAMLGGYGARLLNVLRALEGGEGVEFPLVVGRDFVGEVERAGPASRLQRGARVWGVVPPHRQGSHAEFVVVRDSWAGPAPRTMDDTSAGGTLYAALTACSALRAAGLPPGERARRTRVLLLGLGGVGQAALQLLVHSGAEVVVGCAGDAQGAARALGAAAALDRHAADYGRQLEDAGPYEVIMDCAGLGGAEAGARRWRYSRYVTLTTPLLRETDARGVCAGGAAAAAALGAQWAGAWGAAEGAGGAGARPQVRWAYFVPCAGDIELLRRLAERGRFAVCVERAFDWREAVEAFERLGAGSVRGKLVLDFASAAPSA